MHRQAVSFPNGEEEPQIGSAVAVDYLGVISFSLDGGYFRHAQENGLSPGIQEDAIRAAKQGITRTSRRVG